MKKLRKIRYRSLGDEKIFHLKKEKKMHVLVGGGTGFIGRHLIKQLNKTGHKVTIVSRSPPPSAGRDYVTWDDVERGTTPDDITAIVNLAGAQILSIKAELLRGGLTKKVVVNS